jgi:hypothetical protein
MKEKIKDASLVSFIICLILMYMSVVIMPGNITVGCIVFGASTSLSSIVWN